MLFNSIDFAIFLPIVFFLYRFVANKKIRTQNILLILASYIFYGWWDWRFLTLIVISSILDYIIGLKLSKENILLKRKILLAISVIVNLGLLGFFKYYNFFIDNFVTAYSLLGRSIELSRLKIILPVGISFYTFQTLSYTIDVYNKKLKPTNDIIAFFAFVCFFPQLVAGPIERATNLLPQFYVKREFEYSKAVDGLKQILWGFFKKIVIADNCAYFANLIFNNYTNYSGITLLLGAIFFAFQIYGDFSGYSDIAIGISRLFGFSLMKNFAFPYFSRDIAEFWRRWHISLSTWFRDYLYIPLGGSKGNLTRKIRNIFIIFIVSGFWHGANWTFIVWGALNALYFLPLLLLKKNRNNLNVVASGKKYPHIKDIMNMVITFMLTLVAWIFFRSNSITQAIGFIIELFAGLTDISSYMQSLNILSSRIGLATVFFLLFFIIIEWIGRTNNFAIEKIGVYMPRPYRWFFYYILVMIIFLFQGSQQQFIYFQF